MAEQHLKTIFLSASIPHPGRERKYYDTADIMAIRDAVRALATVTIPHTRLIWGGHPAISPLIKMVMETMNADVQEHVVLYQSEYYKNVFPEENSFFGKIELTARAPTRDESLLKMRKAMIGNHSYDAGIFIGGMEGVEEEFEMFRTTHPRALLMPLASTGAAALIIYQSAVNRFNERLLNDYAYMSLFRDLLMRE